MADGIFLKSEQGAFLSLKEAPYPTENALQELIAQHPAILAGGQADGETAPRWLLISREMGVPCEEDGGSQWFLDHLFLDSNGIPTFVEVKRSTDTRIRREVVGQMLDYAANAAAYWNPSDIRRLYEKSGRTLEEELGLDPVETEAFWETVGVNLRCGKLRLLFAADAIPRSLLRIIEFLNGQMVNTEILGLEIKQYLSDDGRQLFVSRIVGQTTQAMDVKRPEKREWDHDSFLEDVEKVGGGDLRALAERVMADFSAMGCRVWFGRGRTHSSIVLTYDGARASTQLFSVYPWKKTVFAELYFKHYKAPFDTPERRRPLKERFERVLGLTIPEQKLQGRPSFPFEKLADEQVYQAFLGVMQTILDGIKAFEREQAEG